MDPLSVAAAGQAWPLNSLGPEGLKTLTGPYELPKRLDPSEAPRDMHVLCVEGPLGGDPSGTLPMGVELPAAPQKGFDPLHPVPTDVQFF